MEIILTSYWIVTTIYGAYWAVKNPPSGLGSDPKHFTLLEVIAKLFPAMLIAWLAIPLFLLHQIKFKR